MKKLFIVVGVVVLVAALGLMVVNVTLAQSSTPPAQATPTEPQKPFFWGGKGFGLGGRAGSFENFDAIAKALNLTPTQLFVQLHEGKTLEEIAKAQGVDLTKVQEAAKASQLQAMKDAIAQAVKDGKMTQEQADWLVQGLDKGYIPGGRGFGPGGHGRGGMRGMGMWGGRQATPAPAPGTSS